MTDPDERKNLQTLAARFGRELHRKASNQLHVLVDAPSMLRDLSILLRQARYYLTSVVANDERELEDHCFKLYYLFSHPTIDLFLMVENPLPAGSEYFTSISTTYPAAIPFEAEIEDLYGLLPEGQSLEQRPGVYLHACYPPALYPLRRDRSEEEIQKAVTEFLPRASNLLAAVKIPPEGEVYLPVGPVHAGVIESGHFLLRVGSEAIENLDIHLGYTHRGVERLFQSAFSLQDGWVLAEQVSGDSCFGHSLAYCHAIEALTHVLIPEEAGLLRSVFLELERLVNHIGDSAALAQDLGLLEVSSEIAVLREELLRLNERVCESRFQRGLNRPGGVILPHPFDPMDILESVSRVVERFVDLARMMVELDDFRERTIGIGILSESIASELGITGLAARSSGIARDFRRQHPFDAYNSRLAQEPLSNTYDSQDLLPVMYQRLTGDVYSRFLVRVYEINTSRHLLTAFLANWRISSRTEFLNRVNYSSAQNFDIGLGYSEGWRGDIVYWVMKDKFEGIYRCKVRDPSTLNWQGVKAAVDPHWCGTLWADTAVVDFPVINKSFNLSYAGHDL